MCEWNYKVKPDGTVEKNIEGNILYMFFKKLLWRIRVWNHGPQCKWGNLLAQLVGGGS